jgi:hypothetical protein
MLESKRMNRDAFKINVISIQIEIASLKLTSEIPDYISLANTKLRAGKLKHFLCS